LKDLKNKNQIVLRYAGDNPNGSTDLIAAICNEDGNVMGMMPHPERASERILTVDRSNNSSDAITIFRSLVSNLNQKAIA
jgi:phosphoribosylformylglycinamidine synthase subunit PurQ / glutaminase